MMISPPRPHRLLALSKSEL